MARKKAKTQIRLDIKSNAGGTGKTTLALHTAFLLAQKGYSVCIFEMDPQGSLQEFVDLPEPAEEYSVVRPLLSNTPVWNGLPIWKEHNLNVTVIQGGDPLGDKLRIVENHVLGNFLLSKRLDQNPIDADVLIFDNNASVFQLGLLSLVAATHILVPIQCEPKAAGGAAKLIEVFFEKLEEFGLTNGPEFLGFVPFRYDKTIAAHRAIYSELKEILAEMQIECFPPVRDSNEFLNACLSHKPLMLHRPGHDANKDFDPLIKKIVKLLTGR